jgi:hypothetical protein
MTSKGRRTRTAIARDLRECAVIWRERAEQCFGNRSAIDYFNHAVMCAERFEAQLNEIAPENRTREPERLRAAHAGSRFF